MASTRRVVVITLFVIGGALVAAVVAIAPFIAGMWWQLGGSDWWHRDEFRHALEDTYRDNSQAFDEAADIVAGYSARHPGAEWISVSAGSACVSDPPLNGWECYDLTALEREVLASIRVDEPDTETSLHWVAQHDDLVFVTLFHETRDGGRLVHDPDGGDLLGFVDDSGHECVEMLDDDWCSMDGPKAPST